jgi:MFS family permease
MSDPKADPPAAAQAVDLSPVAPLREPVFRMLWLTWLVANVCMWMNDVAAAWLMTSLTDKALWVALVQTASTLPVFLLGLPSGALADILDRKRYFLVTQLWVAVVGAVLCAAVLMGALSPLLLLMLTFANGIGLAMRWPVFAAIVPELVARPQLPAALALNGVSMNASRIIGPLLAGALIASAGIAWVFLLNAVLSLAAAVVISRWKRVSTPDPLGRERLVPAMRVGYRYVMQSRPLKAVLLRISLFFFHSTAIMALLALVAKGMQGGDAATFTFLLAAMGAGAIAAAGVLPRLRRRYVRDQLVFRGATLQAVSMAVMASTDHVGVALPAMFLCGAAWITTANSLSVSMQLGLPNWVRARGMSIYQMALMGSSAVGAAVWGQVATVSSVAMCLFIASVTSVISMYLAIRSMPDTGTTDDLTPHRLVQTTAPSLTPSTGQVVITVEYTIDPDRAADFRLLMTTEGRRRRLRHGALSWELLHDINQPQRFLEVIIDESWTEHLRRFDRNTADDILFRERKQLFHLGVDPPRIHRYVMETTVRA